MYLATLDCAISNPSVSSSPWMRGAPQSNTRGAGLNPGRPAFAAATLEAANGMTSHSKTCYADIVRCLARRWPRDAEFRLRAISLTLTMGDDQFTIDLLDHLLKF